MKKLFSYLLISSMVVLSSCTNYDDQFDDLNTQINALKSQIEGFSSLSTGLTSLQSTVAGLQTAVASIPETDLSGLESDLTDLSNLVEALQAQVAATATALEEGAVSDAAVAAAITVIQNNQAALDTAVAAVSAAQATLATAVADAAAAQTADAAALTAAQEAADEAAADLAAAVADLATELTALGTTNAELKTVTDLIQASVTLLSSGQAANTTSIAGLVDAVAALDTASLSTLINTLSTAVTSNTEEILASILAANSIYSTAVSITDNASLDFAVALGDQLKVVNEKVTIVQSRDMDVTKLQSVMDKFVSVVNGVSYTATATGITSIGTFTNLSSTKSLTLDVAGDVSLPALTSVTSNLTIANNTKLTEISAPSLTKVGSFGFASEYTKVNSVDLSSLVRTPGAANATFSLRIDSGTVDLSSLITTTDATPSAERTAATIEVDGATIVKAPLITSGTLKMDSVLEPNFPVWQGTTGSQFDEATKVVLPKITGDVKVDLDTFAPEATYFHMIGNEYNNPLVSGDASSFPTFDAGTTNGNLVTLILDGDITTVTVDGASDLTEYTHTGASHNVDFKNNGAITAVEFGYTSSINTGAKAVAIKTGSLDIQGNARLVSVTADKLDDISELIIKTNLKLETISFAALNSLGTTSTGTPVTAANVDITGNKFSASLIQLPSAPLALPVVKGSITESAGLKAISTWIGLAAAKDANAEVVIDDVVEVLLPSGLTASGSAFDINVTKHTQTTQTWSNENDPVAIVRKSTSPGVTGVTAVNQKSTVQISGTPSGATVVELDPLGNGTIASTAFTTAFTSQIAGYVAADIDTWAEALEADLDAKLLANDSDFTLSIVNDFGVQGNYTIDILDGDGTVSDGSGALTGGVVSFTFGKAHATAALAGTGFNSTASLTEEIVRAINSGSVSDTWSAATGTSNKVTVYPMLSTTVRDYAYTDSFESFTGFSEYGKATSATSFLPASATVRQLGFNTTKGWRLTLESTDQTVAAANLEFGTASTTDGGFAAANSGIVMTGLLEGRDFEATSQTGFHTSFTDVVKGVTATSVVVSIDLRTWF